MSQRRLIRRAETLIAKLSGVLAEMKGQLPQRSVTRVYMRRGELHPRHDEIVTRLTAGEAYQPIAADLNKSATWLSHYARCHGLPHRGRGGASGMRDPSRDAEIVALRESKMTYEEIAQRYGISRERVRQILNKMGRIDLLNEFTVANGINRDPRVEWHCEVCGKAKMRLASTAKRIRFCSARCAHAEGNLMRERAPVIMQMRRDGKTWAEIGEHFNTPYESLHTRLRKLAKREGWDTTGVFGVRNGLPRGHRRPAPVERGVAA